MNRSPNNEQFNEMIDHINNKNYQYLYKHDQLIDCIYNTQCSFVGFNEALNMINFPPTFKIISNITSLKYNKKRSPAYCDRILYYTIRKNHLKCLEYNSALNIISSDHKPVYAIFNVLLNNLSIPTNPNKENIYLAISNEVHHFNIILHNNKNNNDLIANNITHIILYLKCINKPLKLNYPINKKVIIKLNYNSLARISLENIYCKCYHDEKLIGATIIPIIIDQHQKYNNNRKTYYTININSLITYNAIYIGTLKGQLNLISNRAHKIISSSKISSKNSNKKTTTTTTTNKKTRKKPSFSLPSNNPINALLLKIDDEEKKNLLNIIIVIIVLCHL